MSKGNKQENVIMASNEEEWNAQISKDGLKVVDCYSKWAGPCECMASIFKRLKVENPLLLVIQALSDTIPALESFRNKSCPTFLFYHNNVLVNVVRGVNSPLIEQLVKDQMIAIQSGQVPKPYFLDDATAKTEHAPKSAGKAAFNHPDITKVQETFAMIKPDGMCPGKLEQIQDLIRLNRFEIVKQKKIWLTDELVAEIYRDLVGRPFYNSVRTYLTAAPVMCLALAKENAISLWRDIVGPASSIHAKEVAPNSIRALYGTDSRINAVFGADSQEMAARLKSLLLDSSIPELPMNDFSKSFGLQKTLVIIKPNMVPDKVDEIIDRILCKGFQVAKREQIELKPELIAQLYPKMKDQQKIDFMTSGPVVALAVTGEGAIEELKEMFGPNDPKEALEKYPMSLRAQFGTDRIKNVVHTSTTIEDATHEIELLFPFSLRKNGSSIFQNRTRPTSASNNEARASQLQLHAQIERTVAIIKPDGMKRKSEIIEIIDKNGFKIVKQYENRISLKMAQDLYKEHIDKPFYEELTTWLSSYPVIALVLEKHNAIGSWRELIGPVNPAIAKEAAPNSIRAIFGTDGMQNAIHGSDSPQAAEREIVIFFGDTVAPEPAPLDLQITFALIKPDAMPKKDEIIEIIKREGFQISKELELKMSPEMAKEFYSEHEGKPFFGTLCNWMSSAPIYALILEKVGAIKEWRALAGPTNSETARSSAPTSIRALYGKDGSENAVHGSDSYNSAQREIKLVFGDSVLDAINSSLASAKSDLKDVHSSRSNLKKTASKSSVPDLKKSGSKLNLIKSASKEILNSITKSASKASLSKSGSKGSLLKMS